MDSSYVPCVVQSKNARCRQPRRSGIGQFKADRGGRVMESVSIVEAEVEFPEA
jgi:hypothetical protein